MEPPSRETSTLTFGFVMESCGLSVTSNFESLESLEEERSEYLVRPFPAEDVGKPLLELGRTFPAAPLWSDAQSSSVIFLNSVLIFLEALEES